MSLQIRQHSFNPTLWFVTLAIGVLLVTLATPGLISLYKARSATRLVSDLNNSANDHTQAELDVAVQQLMMAVGYEPGRRQLHKERATILLYLYHKQKAAGRERDANNSLEQASLTIVKSLKLAPGNANLWYLLAEIRALQGRMDSKAQRYLSMSYLSGPREGWIAVRRLQFSLRYWLLLDKGLRHHVKREIRILWSDPSYQRTLMRQFSKNTARAQRVIFSEIKSYGDEDTQKFLKLAERAGWNTGILKSAY